MTLALIVGFTFLLASLSLGLSLNERDARIRENEKRIDENSRRQDRNCERITAIVDLLDRITPDYALKQQLARIDARYPDVPQCPSR